MRISYLLLATILALLHVLHAKKCCNHDCSQVISQGRSFRVYTPQAADELPLERDVKVWVFMKEMGVNEEGDEMWYGESRGKNGFFPKQLIGEYMVLCRDLVEIEDTWEQPIDNEGEKNREDESQIHPEIGSGGIFESLRDNPEIPDTVNEWRLKSDPIETADFHAPDTEAMNNLKRQMDQEFLNRILEAEGVLRLDEIEPDRYSELLSDPSAARIILEAEEAARQPEVPSPPPPIDDLTPVETPLYEPEIVEEYVPPVEEYRETSHREDFTYETPDVYEEVTVPSEAHIDDGYREISNQEDHYDSEPEYESGSLDPFESSDSELSELETTDESVYADLNDPYREISQPETTDEYVHEHVDDPTLEISQPETTDEYVHEHVDDPTLEISQPETTDEFVHEVVDDPDREISQLEDAIEDNQQEIPIDQSPTELPSSEDIPHENSHPEEQHIEHENTKLFGFIPSPLGDIIRDYIHRYGVFYITLYTAIPLLITHLYVSRSSVRNEVVKQKILTVNHVKALEQKVATLQKDKKTLESKIAKNDTLKEANAASQEELISLKSNLGTCNQELESKSRYIMQLESESTQCNSELLSTQNALNDKCIEAERLGTLNSSAQEEILSLNSKMDIIHGQMRQVDTEKMTLQLRLDANIDSFAELKERLAKVEKNRDEVEREKASLQDELKQREVRISANSERIHTLEGEIDVLTNSLLKLQPQAVGKSQVTDTQVKTIFDTLTNTAKALSELEQVTIVKDKFELQNKFLSEDNVTLKARCEDLDDNLSCVKSSNILLKKQLGDSDTKLQVLNEYFNTKESELHRQLNESRNSQLLLEGKDHRSHDEIDSVRSEREGLKSEITELKQQHSQREKSLLEQIASLEKRVQENIYNSRRNEQEIRWRDREITELKRKLGESSLPSSQVESYLSPRSVSPSSQLSSNSDSEAKNDKNRQSPTQFSSAVPTLPNFTSGPPSRLDAPPIVTTAQVKPTPLPGYHPGFMPPPPNYYPPAPFPPMMPAFAPRQVMPQNMAHFNSPTVPMKHKPTPRPPVVTQDLNDTPTPGNIPPTSRSPPEYYAPSPPTLIDTPPNTETEYNGSLLDSQTRVNTHTPTQKEANAFLIDV
ncbi:CTAGE family member 5-like [Oopsacas minuta]|uniref:CTAGE family member 5-like n=1 Tax=Oopsacas minuta TaxID=111878 RepID=A0AAV7K873_9METZ|nr:CTAGE family member 5-like [Oopsacas minuta]